MECRIYKYYLQYRGRVRLKYNPLNKNIKKAMVIVKKISKNKHIDYVNVNVNNTTNTILLKHNHKMLSVKMIINLVTNQELPVSNDINMENQIQSLKYTAIDFLQPRKLSIPLQKIQIAYYLAFSSALTLLESLLEKYTMLIKYTGWKWYWSLISMCIVFWMTRKVTN